MIAPSAVPDTFDENKVLYTKELVNGEEVFVYSTNPEEELFQVRFSKVGENQGNYVLTNASAITRTYEYVLPVNGIPQGNYEPVIRLFAPTKLQVGVVHGKYQPSEKTKINFEFAASNNDENLFSELDNDDNDGFAGRVEVNQRVVRFKDSSLVEAFAGINYIQNDFQSIEPLYNVEFNRDWNLVNPLGNQNYIQAGINFKTLHNGSSQYRFEQLDYSENYNGTRHIITSQHQIGKLRTQLYGSYLKSESEIFDSQFSRMNASAVYDFGKVWAGTRLNLEDNQQKENETQQLTGISQRFNSYEVFAGVGTVPRFMLK